MTVWFERIIGEVVAQFRWSFLPPLMVYFAAGLSGATGIVATFVVKDYLNLSAEFLAGLLFWAGLPWAAKMPLGHLIDIFWRWKGLLVYLGALFIAASLTIMYGVIIHPAEMREIASLETWYVTSVILAPCGYVIQDAVADAMSVEAVPRVDEAGNPLPESLEKAMHTTMQTLGRVSLFIGLITVSLLNITMFSGVAEKAEAVKVAIYGQIYLLAMAIPLLSISGVVLASFLRHREGRRLRLSGISAREIAARLDDLSEKTDPNYLIFGGSLAFIALTLVVGLNQIPYSKEIIFLTSLLIIGFLMMQLARELSPSQAKALFGTALILFVFRAIPGPGPGVSWFEIDILKFDQQFLSVLTLITSVLTLAGMIVLRPFMARHTIATIILVLAVAGAVLSLPNIGLYYGVHEWTAAATNGIVDARFIAILDTAMESPLGQIAVIPMLAWIARNAPNNLKATFFAVMASFSNLALSASSLLTSYLNRFFVVEREVKNPETGVVEIAANYGELGSILLTVLAVGLALPLLTIFVVQHSPLKTRQ
ncbi:MAG: hypothetical protein AAFW47_03045 [Pseudomonadota bacterium]